MASKPSLPWRPLLELATLVLAAWLNVWAFVVLLIFFVASYVLGFTRLTTTVMLLLVPILGVWTWAEADRWGVWFPPHVSAYGDEVDNLFYIIMWMVAVTFVLTEGALVWFFFRFSKKDSTRAEYSHGNHTLELVWTAIPSVLLVFIAFSQMGAWNSIKLQFPDGSEGDPYTAEAPLMEVWASQFDWRARYPDTEGSLRSSDAVESAYDIYVPMGVKVVLHLRSRDVLHSFFVPKLRIKQDAVPGMTIPVWFEATATGSFDLICAELCGWGHYKMSGRIHVLEQAEFDAWLAAQREAHFANGLED